MTDADAERRDAALWTAGLVVVLSLHAAGFLLLRNQPAADAGPASTPVMIDLMPLPAPPAPAPQPAAAPAPAAEPPRVEPPPPDPPVEPKPPQDAAPVEPAVQAPPLPDAAPVQPPPTVAPPQEVPKAELELPKPVREDHPRHHAAPRAERRPRPEAVRPSPAQAIPSPNPAPAPVASSPPAAAPVEPRASAGARDSWEARLQAHLARFRHYPPDAERRRREGTAVVRFTMTASGAVLQAALLTSSGMESLDQEALALLQRAQPLPAPPTGSPATIQISVPIRFVLHG